MATSCPAIGTDDMLEFCLMPWVAFGEEDITVTQIAVAAKVSSLLASAKRFEVFDNFVGSLPERVLKMFLKNEQFRRALIDLRRQQERHEEICELIKVFFVLYIYTPQGDQHAIITDNYKIRTFV